jgi:peptidoglycan/LPS O-acetylase OafA/YrhL
MTQKTAINAPQKIQVTHSTARIPALDFTKGILVLFMVLYHWLNYFYSPYGNFYKYLRFLTPSFIFITGFLISHVYFARYGIANKQVPKRLAGRGLKVLGIFVVLNGVIAVLPGSPDRAIFARDTIGSDLVAILVTGNVLRESGKLVSFGILVPIGYLLLISALLVQAFPHLKYIFHVVCLALFAAVFLLRLFRIEISHLELLAIGLLGVVSGYTSGTTIRRFAHNSYMLYISYTLYLFVITMWDVTFVLRVLGVCLTLMVFYAIGDRIEKPRVFAKHIIVLGKYSLFGYIWQIALLQLLCRVLSRSTMAISPLALSFVVGFALTMVGVEVLDRLRPQWRALDKLYRFGFA